MLPSAFEYARASSVEHAVELLGAIENAKLLAGGHSLLPLMKLRFAQPSALIDIGGLEPLRYVREAAPRVTIGALTSHHDVATSAVLRRACPLLSATAEQVGDPQVRHRGTIGGSVAHGDAAGDLPTALLALDAELRVCGPRGERVIAAGDFFHGDFDTALAEDEMLTEVSVAELGEDCGWAYLKFRPRAQDWATVGVAARVRVDGDRVLDAAVALTNMGSTPLRATAVEQALVGASVDAIPAAADAADEGTSPRSDANASAEYRRHLAKVLVRRALNEAVARSRGASS